MAIEESPVAGRRSVARVAIAVVAVLVGGALGWAASVVFTPPKDVLDSTAYTYVEVAQGEVGSSINLNTVAEWTTIPIGSNKAAGTVTSVKVAAGDQVKQGSTLYTVDLRPVKIAKGAVPAFRALTQGVTGPDVKQLQRMLKTLGYYKGSLDGSFSWSTTSAVRAWQKKSGVAQDGVVQPGDVIFVPDLPTRVSLDATLVSRGATLVGGEKVLSGLPATPSFRVPISDQQAGLMPTGTRVEIAGTDGGQWEGYVVERTTDENGSVSAVLAGKDDAPICADACGSIPVDSQSFFASRIVTIEAVSGLTVPSAALLTLADGSIVVIDDTGEQFTVSITQSARGMSVIDGVSAGTKVRVPASVNGG
jgi:peptidoglycan hydrolase-like protein with peptidoglycan-binding domain